MAGGVPSIANGPAFEGKVTFYVYVCVVIAAFGGLIFGYDIGISGGVTAMDDFLKLFFPAVWERKKHVFENNYCKYDNQFLQLFTSSLYLAALVASFVASAVCSKLGRKPTVQIASVFFLIGVGMTAGAVNLVMLIFGRLFLGFGVGFGNQAVPLFLSEIAPPKHRGALNIAFQLMVTIGILIANLVNYFTAKVHPNGWRIALGGAGVPSIILLVGSLLICETPTSLIERNKHEEGKATLRKIRGVEDIEKEYESIVHACDIASQVKDPYMKLFESRESSSTVCHRKASPDLLESTRLCSMHLSCSRPLDLEVTQLFYNHRYLPRRFLLLQSSVHMLIFLQVLNFLCLK